MNGLMMVTTIRISMTSSCIPDYVIELLNEVGGFQNEYTGKDCFN